MVSESFDSGTIFFVCAVIVQRRLHNKRGRLDVITNLPLYSLHFTLYSLHFTLYSFL